MSKFSEFRVKATIYHTRTHKRTNVSLCFFSTPFVIIIIFLKGMMGNWVKKGKDAMNDTITSLKKITFEDPVKKKIKFTLLTSFAT